MTREEAKEALSVLKIYDNQWLREAIDMAIREMTILGNSGIVNCCGCTHWESDGGSMMVCDLWDAPMNDFDYCSYGERGDTE